jgi:hypothetical protein
MNQTRKNFSNIESEVPCYQLQIIGAYCLLLFIISLTFNLLFTISVFKTKQLHQARYYILACLGVLNLIGTFLELPIVAASGFNCK